MAVFIVDCPKCRAKVAAEERGRAENTGHYEYDGEVSGAFGARLIVGICPNCRKLLAGESTQIHFEGLDHEFDEWSDVVRIFPNPPKTFTSHRIPNVVKDSLAEADRCLQAGAHTAACVMLGRALEGLCRDNLESKAPAGRTKTPERPLMLGKGIERLKDKGIIDTRLFEWSRQLQAFRNLAAHASDSAISREDSEDLQSFVYAIVEYVYDLADRYDEFKERLEIRNKRKKST